MRLSMTPFNIRAPWGRSTSLRAAFFETREGPARGLVVVAQAALAPVIVVLDCDPMGYWQ
jgi:hypothetical protein